MSFYTSLTGLNASSAQLGITSNNVSNVGTVGFKKSRAEFGDIFATSPLENASSAIGQGVLLKKVNQQFSQGNIEFSSNSLDLAISGQGFFALKPNQTSNNTAYTRAGSFSVNNDRYMVDSTGQYLQAFPVNDDGSVVATDLVSAKSLQLPSTSGLPVASSKIAMGLNLPAGAEILSKTKFSEDNPYRFSRSNSDTYNKSTSITLYDSLGNPHIATVYYIKTSSATENEPTNKWDTKIFIGENELVPKLINAKNDKSETLYMNKFGQISADPSLADPTFNPKGAHPLYYNDEQKTRIDSQNASISGGFMATDVGHDFGSTDENRINLRNGSSSVTNGDHFFSVSVDGSDPRSISVPSGEYTGTLLAAEMTKQANAAFGDDKYIKLPTKVEERTISIAMQKKDGTPYNSADVENGTSIVIDQYFDGTQTPPKMFTLEQLIRQVKDKVREAGLPVEVAYSQRKRAFTFTATNSDFVKIRAKSGSANEFGLSATPSFAIDGQPYVGSQIVPKGETILDGRNQRSGILIEYNKDARKFTFSSGISGETSKITVGVPDVSYATKMYPGATASADDVAELASVAGVTSWTFPTSTTLTAATCGELKAIFPGGAANIYSAVFNTDQETTLAALASAIQAGEDSIYTATVNADKTGIDFTGLADGTTMSRGGFSITTGTISAAATPIDIITTVAKAKNPPDTTTNGGIAVAQTPAVVIASSTSASTTVKFGAPTTAIAANDTARVTIDGQNFTTAALAANATAADVADAFAALTVTGWDTTSNGVGSVVFSKNAAYVGGTTGGTAAAGGTAATTNTTEITTTTTSLALTMTGTGVLSATATDIAPGTDKTKAVVGLSTMNLSGLDLIKGDRVTVLVDGGAKTITGSFDTDLKTTIANLAADLKLETNTFSDVTVDGYIITFKAGSDGSAMPTLAASVQTSTLEDVGIQKVGSKYLSNSNASDSTLTLNVNNVLGIGETYDKELQSTTGDGLESTPGIATGSKAGVDISSTFSVLSENNVNVINVTIDGIDGEVVIPPGSYTGTTFASAMQERINLIRSEEGRQIANVKVDFNLDSQSFAITSGTVGSESFVNINGSSNWGLNNTTQIRGNVPEITVIQQATDTEGNKLFIGLDGKETTVPPKVLPTWAPIYLDKGELTFNTKGKLISPKEGVIYSPYDPDNGSNLLRLSVDYGKNSTQYSAPFSVLSLSQDGYPSGRLDGLAIDSSGVVRANYTNGNQVALGKLILANFANPNGLKQVGNANYVSTATSGSPVLGQAGSDGYGTIQGGALERANVDLTEELVNLITAQRNFQANAKAIETSSTLTQTIINIRG